MQQMFEFNAPHIQKVLSTALQQGGHYADLYIEETQVRSIELQDGKVSQAQQSSLYGAGIRVVLHEQTGYAYTMDLSMPSLLDAARFAGSIAPYQKNISRREKTLYPVLGKTVRSEFEVLENQQARHLLLHINKMAREKDNRVIRVKAALTQRTQTIHFANSNSETYTDHRPRTAIMLNVVLEENGITQMGYATEMLKMDAAFITPERTTKLINEAINRAAFLFGAIQPTGGEMPVVMAAGGSGILLHEAIGHAFEADFIRQGTSIFTGRLGKTICSKDITIVDDGTQPNDAGHLTWDDEGIPGQYTTLVHEGKLESFIHDRISAKHFGVAPTGNGRRESFRHVPQPRMRSTYMLSGDANEDDIIRSVKKGIYAQVFTNGQVQIGAGDFTFYMKQWYLIEDGKLTQPICDVNITGNGPQALQDICMVGNNLHIDHSAAMCRKGGQSVPVSQGLPTLRINKLIVG